MNAHAKEPISQVSRTRQFGRYRVLTQLGQGGMGAIHLAVTADMGDFEKLVVIKELRPELSRSADLVTLFLREVKLAARLNHANIVHTLEAGQVGERYFMSMEFLDGQTFAKVIARASPIRLRLQILCEALAGLHYAHELCDYDGTPLSVVHCDVSFGNVFVTYDGQVKLVDFGVARVAESLSRTSGFQGKVRYAAPEQLTGGPIDRRADVFAAGILLWECLAMRRYTAGLNSDREIVEARLTRGEPRLSQVVPDVDRELAAICDRALAMDPARRFATAQDFRAALAAYLAKSGPPVDASELSRFMKSEFASEHARVHQLISAQLRRDGAPSAPTTLERIPGHDDVTTIADLSTLIESISSKSVPLVRPKVDTSKHTLVKVFAGTILVVVAGLAFMRGRAAPPSPAESEADQPLMAAASPGELGGPAQTSSAQSTSGPGSAAQGGGPAAGKGDETAQREASDDVGAVVPRPGVAGRDNERADVRDRADAQRRRGRAGPTPPSATEQPTPRSEPVPRAEPTEPSKRAPAGDVFDQELGPRNKSDRAGIDADNPFK
jgi:serine/threonine protein kinase